MKEREEKLAKLREEKGPIWKIDGSDDTDMKPQANGAHAPQAAPKVKDIIGRALPHIGTYKNLDNKQQKVALIDDVSCFLQFMSNICFTILFIF